MRSCQIKQKKLTTVSYQKTYQKTYHIEKEEEIGNSYDKIVEEIQIVCDRTIKESEKIAKVDELCLYFGSNYIKSLVPNREALFPPSLWNQRDAASSGLARTTNAVEGWHYGIQSYFSGSHPSIWKVIANLQKDASVQKLNFYNASSGHQFTKKKNTGCSTKKCRILCMFTKKKLICISFALWRT